MPYEPGGGEDYTRSSGWGPEFGLPQLGTLQDWIGLGSGLPATAAAPNMARPDAPLPSMASPRAQQNSILQAILAAAAAQAQQNTARPDAPLPQQAGPVGALANTARPDAPWPIPSRSVTVNAPPAGPIVNTARPDAPLPTQAAPVVNAPLPPPRPATAKPRIDPRTVDLGYYYAPTPGNARTSARTRFTDPNDPRIYRGSAT